MNYSFFQEYQKCILCFVFAVVLMCAQYFLKYDLNEIIRIILQIMAGGLGAGAIKYSVLPTSEKEAIGVAKTLLQNSKIKDDDEKPGSGETLESEISGKDFTAKPYDGSKRIQTILYVFILSALMSGSVLISGCASNQVCFSCKDKVLSWQGNITGLTSGRYIETACFKLDLFAIISNISAGEISWDDLSKSILVEVVLKDGEFCDPNDKSYYKITLQSDETDPDKKIIYSRKDAIILKENNNPEK